MNKARRVPKAKKVLIFGEDENDTKSLREHVAALCPELSGRIEIRRRPQIHLKQVPLEKMPGRIEKIERQLRVEGLGPDDVVCLLIHEDCDAVEPEHENVASRLETSFAKHSRYQVHAVAPAWEVEAWWLLWPQETASIRSSWLVPDKHVNKEVGRLRNAKEELSRLVTPAKPRSGFLGYRESDSILIATAVRRAGVIRQPRAISASFDRFVRSVDTFCAA